MSYNIWHKHMKDNLILQDKNYISAKRASIIFGYTSDYVGQLCRLGKLECKMIGRSWFVSEESVIKHREAVASDLNSKVNSNIGADTIKSVDTGSDFTVHLLLLDSQKFIYLSAPTLISTPVSTPIETHITSSVPTPPPFYSASVSAFASAPLKSHVGMAQSMTIHHFGDFKKIAIVSAFFVFAFLFIMESSFGLSNNVANVISKITNSNSGSLVEMQKPPPDPNSESSFGGLAVVSSSNTEDGDERIKQKIRDSFSDEVEVKPDSSRTAGVITPVFRKVRGDDFVYVMVPIKN